MGFSIPPLPSDGVCIGGTTPPTALSTLTTTTPEPTLSDSADPSSSSEDGLCSEEINPEVITTAVSAYLFIYTNFNGIMSQVISNPSLMPPVDLLVLFQSLSEQYGTSLDWTTNESFIKNFPTEQAISYLTKLDMGFSVPPLPANDGCIGSSPPNKGSQLDSPGATATGTNSMTTNIPVTNGVPDTNSVPPSPILEMSNPDGELESPGVTAPGTKTITSVRYPDIPFTNGGSVIVPDTTSVPASPTLDLSNIAGKLGSGYTTILVILVGSILLALI